MLGNETINMNVPNLTNPMCSENTDERDFALGVMVMYLPVFALSIHLRIEVAVVENNGVCSSQAIKV